jgi:hypothetical protein
MNAEPGRGDHLSLLTFHPSDLCVRFFFAFFCDLCAFLRLFLFVSSWLCVRFHSRLFMSIRGWFLRSLPSFAAIPLFRYSGRQDWNSENPAQAPG